MMWNRRQFLSSSAALPLAAAPKTKAKPNIVFLFSDDHHWQCLGAAGNPHIKTPNLDRLAREGVHFTNTVASTSQCCPSRGIMLSGLESYQNGLVSNGQTTLKEGFPTVIEQLRRSGYRTTHVGKWHVQNRPWDCGFDESPLWLAGGGGGPIDPLLREGRTEQLKQFKGHVTNVFTEAGVNAIRSAKQPYLLWMAYTAPHTPLRASPQFADMYKGQSIDGIAPPIHPKGGAPWDWPLYYAVISELDAAVGRIVDTIKQAGQWENTVIFFVGDNGYMAGTRQWSGKVRHWEESIRVPMIVAGGAVKKAKPVTDPVATVDVPATWLDLAGVKPERMLAGRSLGSYLRSGKGNIDVAYSNWDDGRPEGLAVGVPIEPYRSVRNKRHKLVVFESKKQSLYDYVADPGEERDLIDDQKSAKVRTQLQARLRVRMQMTSDRAIKWL